jgi:hypothetical protein
MIWVEIPGRYDWVAYYVDEDWNRYAPNKNRTPIWRDEVCKLGKVYKVKFIDRRGIKYKILSSRDLNINRDNNV